MYGEVYFKLFCNYVISDSPLKDVGLILNKGIRKYYCHLGPLDTYWMTRCVVVCMYMNRNEKCKKHEFSFKSTKGFVIYFKLGNEKMRN